MIIRLSLKSNMQQGFSAESRIERAKMAGKGWRMRSSPQLALARNDAGYHRTRHWRNRVLFLVWLAGFVDRRKIKMGSKDLGAPEFNTRRSFPDGDHRFSGPRL